MLERYKAGLVKTNFAISCHHRIAPLSQNRTDLYYTLLSQIEILANTVPLAVITINRLEDKL